ncbi:MAG: cell division protein ZapA [Flavobacteriales bacterium TMED96]|nr:MAG: cell division protein ZapA [Flavobacteriales bacterium TMED96]|tara:strand:+ start:733 stop:1032 length:300 start_codon:yes stop_codon:yes gene_type:complete
MENKIKIKVNIADRIYPLTIRPEQEEAIRLSVKKIDQMIKQLEQSYAVRDKQDVLAMCSLQYATKLIQKDNSEDDRNKENLNKISNLNELIKEHIANFL